QRKPCNRVFDLRCSLHADYRSNTEHRLLLATFSPYKFLTLLNKFFNVQSEISIRGSYIKAFKCIFSGVIKLTSSIISISGCVKYGLALSNQSRVWFALLSE